MKILKVSSLIVLLATLFFACQKEYSLENAVTPAGTWQFNNDTKLYAGNIDTAYIETTATTKTLNLVGRSADGQQNFLLHLYATDSFNVGTYKASLFQNDFLYFTQAKTFYQADQFIGEFTVIITAIGNSNISGTFSGLAEDSTGTNKTLTLGKFTSRINLSKNGTGGSGTGTATGTLGASAGVCSQTSTSGTFTQGVSLTSANTATVQVNVTTAGTYTISTNTVNGVSFSGTGSFTTTGVQNVILTGTGTPVNSGNQTFAVTFGSSTCNFSLNFTAGTAPATGTLGGSPGSCTSFTPAGTYTQGTALTSANTVTVQVNVATIGAYTISTNTVKGVSFSKTGTFTTTGLQNVVLVGSGTPTASGSQNFTVTFGSSTCNFSITFAPGTVVSDYFPTTAGSYWVYGNVNADPTDSFKITATSQTITITSQLYNLFTYDGVPPSGSPDSLYYRKGGGLYYENFNVDKLIGSPGTPPDVEYKFLDANVAAGTSWQSSNFTVTDQGVTYTIYIKMTLTAKATTPTTSGVVTSSDVLKVNYDYYVTAAGVPATIFYKEVRWFAKGIGLIYNSFDDLSGSPDIYNIGRYQ
jgi:hypothetical protein